MLGRRGISSSECLVSLMVVCSKKCCSVSAENGPVMIWFARPYVHAPQPVVSRYAVSVCGKFSFGA